MLFVFSFSLRLRLHQLLSLFRVASQIFWLLVRCVDAHGSHRFSFALCEISIIILRHRHYLPSRCQSKCVVTRTACTDISFGMAKKITTAAVELITITCAIFGLIILVDDDVAATQSRLLQISQIPFLFHLFWCNAQRMPGRLLFTFFSTIHIHCVSV